MTLSSKPSQLKIAIVLEKFLPSRGGERYFSLLAEELARMGHEVHVFAAFTERVSSCSYGLHRIPILRYPRWLRTLSFLIGSAHVLKSYDFDIVHGVGRSLAVNVLNPHGGVEKAYLKQEFASIRSRCYYVYRLGRRYLSAEHYLTLWIQKRQYQSDTVRRIIAISQMIRGDIIRYYGVPDEKIVVVFNSVDLERFHPRNRDTYRQAKRMDLGINDATLLLLFVGNNYRLKGVASLLDAMVLLRKWFPTQPFRLLIAGRGQIGHYRRMARRIGIFDNVLFLGPVTRIEEYYAASDIYVHPTFYDSCSLAVLEALATGLPVITSQFNGAADAIVSDAGGKVIENPANVQELAQAIALFFDANRRNEARDITRKWVEPYSPEYNVEKTLQVYYEAIGDRHVEGGRFPSGTSADR